MRKNDIRITNADGTTKVLNAKLDPIRKKRRRKRPRKRSNPLDREFDLLMERKGEDG